MKLTLDLIPSTSFYNNARSELTKKQWKEIRDEVVVKANYTCEVCGIKYANLDCHEKWQYKNKTQKLINLVAICKSCHEVKHFGLAEIKGRRAQALAHLMKINNISEKEAEKYIIDEFKIWTERSKVKWKLDIKILEKFGK